MFSALKKLTGRSGDGPGPGPGPNANQPATMSQSLQKKFAKGVHYNMKMVLKGDRNVGKTSLWKRLQGLSFSEEYTATEEIQVANIAWSYKNSDDIVKVEVWDVVDVAGRKKRLPTDKLKLDNGSGDGGGDVALDANTIDVYKNTHGTILVFDITKAWTWDYVKREIELIPGHIPILILGNRRDMGHHRQIAFDTVLYAVEALAEEGGRSGEIRYAESSMRYGFGLKLVHKFFNLPYLALQREALLKQVQVNEQDELVTLQELDLYAESDDANYDLFIEGLNTKRRQVADALSPPKLSLQEAQAVASAKALMEAKDEKDAAAVAARLTVKSDPSRPSPSQLKHGKVKPMQNGGSTTIKNELNPNPSPRNGNFGNVEDFVPDEDIQGFLEEGPSTLLENAARDNSLALGESSDDEHQNGNPMVAAVLDDLDEFDFKISPVPAIPFREPQSEEDEGHEVTEDAITLTSLGKPGFEMFVTPEFETEPKTGKPESSEEGRSKRQKKGKSGKHSSASSSSSSHKDKSGRSSKKGSKHKTTELEDFLGGGAKDATISLDSSAYEAI